MVMIYFVFSISHLCIIMVMVSTNALQWVLWQCFFFLQKIGIAQLSQRKDESPVNVGCFATNGSQQIELGGVCKTLP